MLLIREVNQSNITKVYVMQEENITKVVFARTVKLLLKQNSYTQKDLAAYTGVSQANVSKWCRGSIPTGDLAMKIASFFNVPIETLFTGKMPSSKRYVDRLAEEKKEADLGRISRRINEMSEELNQMAKEVDRIGKSRTIET